MKILKSTFIILISTMTFWGCSSLYDHFTYTETIETKLTTLSLMDKSDSPFADAEDEVIALKNQIEKMVIYEQGKQKNEITQKMWELLSNDKHLVGSYLKLWEEKGQVNTVFKDEAKPQIEEAFDLMILYETKKDKQSQNLLKNFLDQFKL